MQDDLVLGWYLCFVLREVTVTSKPEVQDLPQRFTPARKFDDCIDAGLAWPGTKLFVL